VCSNGAFSFGGGHSFGYGNQIDAYYGTKPLTNVNISVTEGIKVNKSCRVTSTSDSLFKNHATD